MLTVKKYEVDPKMETCVAFQTQMLCYILQQIKFHMLKEQRNHVKEELVPFDHTWCSQEWSFHYMRFLAVIGTPC